ncbi:MAG: copper-translocating P-type ATPase [Gaiellales bacterium]|nr:MAG: copper-translocating P-type ATPase [Gaiellales bacterium]
MEHDDEHHGHEGHSRRGDAGEETDHHGGGHEGHGGHTGAAARHAGDQEGHGGGHADHGSGHEARGEHEDHGGHGSHHEHMVADFRRRFWVALALTVPVLALSPQIQEFLGVEGALDFTGDSYALLALSTVIYFYGGYPFLRGIVDELKQKQPGMMTLISLAISVAFFYSAAVVLGVPGMVFFWELATLIDVMLLGHWIEMKSIMGASMALEELAALMPADAHKLMHDGSTVDVPIGELALGDRVLVKPGEKIPVDGVVEEGETSVNEAMLTGESKPVSKAAGAGVIGGSVNGEGSVTVSVTKLGEESFLAQVISLVREAQESKSKTQDLANRAALVLTLIAISVGLVTLAAWLLFTGQSFAFALERTVTVMVITCPHALGLAVPLVVAVSTAIAARNGLLIRDRAAFERARNTQAIIFDKTGTLTEGRFGVTDTIILDPGFSSDELLRLAAAVEARSEHPIAQGIVASAGRAARAEAFRAIPGKGAEARVEGRDVKVVSPGWLRENGFTLEDGRVDAVRAQGKTVVFVIVDGSLAGAVSLADVIRPESAEAIRRLKESGVRCMMLTGDNEQVARWVADEVGLDEYFAEVLPQEKAARVREVQARGLVVAMTGDGVNDAPALAQADVGIAIGAGTDVAIETADIILVKSNPLDVTAIISLTRSTYRKMIQNLAWATGYNAFAIPLAAGVLFPLGIILSPAVGAALMSLSTVIVAVNARLLKG